MSFFLCFILFSLFNVRGDIFWYEWISLTSYEGEGTICAQFIFLVHCLLQYPVIFGKTE